jgi:hypothetical protein
MLSAFPAIQRSLSVQVEKIQATLASKADNAEIKQQLASKADVAMLEKVSGGSASTLEGLEKRLQEVQKAQRALQSDIASCPRKNDLETVVKELEAKAAKVELAKRDAAVKACEESMQGCMQELEEIKATAAQLEFVQGDLDALRAVVEAKADRKDLDKVTGGSAGALKSLESSIQALQSQAKGFVDRQILENVQKQTADLAKTVSERLQALKEDLDSKENAKVATKARSEAAIVLDALQSDLIRLREAVGDVSVVDQMQALESMLRSKADSGKVNELAADTAAMKGMLRSVTGSEQMAEVLRRLDALTKAMQQQQEQSADGAIVQQIQHKIQELAHAIDNAASEEAVASLKVSSYFIDQRSPPGITVTLSFPRSVHGPC